MRLSPTSTPLPPASGPRATTVPKISWPSVSGGVSPMAEIGVFSGPPRSSTPSQKCTSEWHTPQWDTSTSTWVPCGSGVGCSSSCSGCSASTTAHARMAVLLH